MNELTAAAPPHEPSAGRPAQRKVDPGAQHLQAQFDDFDTSQQARMDADMLELVMTFEQVYTGLEPPHKAEPHAALLTDDLFPPFPEDFDIPGSQQRRANEPARVLSVWPEREIVRSVTPAGRVAPAAEPPPDIGLDEAMAILRDAEEKGRAASLESRREESEPEAVADEGDGGPHVAVDPQPAVRARAVRTPVPPPPVAIAPPPTSAETMVPTPAPTPKPEASPYFLAWTARSHRMQSFAVAGAVAALLVGIAVGYTMGRASDPLSARAKVHASEHGGTHLRVDYELKAR